MITPISFSSIGFHTYTIFAVINAAIVPCIYLFYPETAGRSLEEMDAYVSLSLSIPPPPPLSHLPVQYTRPLPGGKTEKD